MWKLHTCITLFLYNNFLLQQYMCRCVRLGLAQSSLISLIDINNNIHNDNCTDRELSE